MAKFNVQNRIVYSKTNGAKSFSFLCYTILSTHLTLASNVLRKKQGQDVDITSKACSYQSPAQLQQGSMGELHNLSLIRIEAIPVKEGDIFSFFNCVKDSLLSCLFWKQKRAFSKKNEMR